MASIREIITDWTAAGNAGGSSIMYFPVAGTASIQRADLGTFWAAINAQLSTTTRWTIRTEGREIDEATGTLTGAWNDSTVRTGAGLAASGPVANTSQVLIRWNTNRIVNGRFLKGRTFVPGVQNGLLTNGELSAAGQTAFNTAIAALIGSNAPLIWHRPSPSGPGVADVAGASSVWNEFAVQRRRRV